MGLPTSARFRGASAAAGMGAMAKLTKRVVEAAAPSGRDYFLWCDELPGFGVRIFASGRRSYCVQYRKAGRSRRVTIGLHGPVTAEEARTSAKVLLGRVARGEDPAEEKAARRGALTVAELCADYMKAAQAGFVLGRGGRPKKTGTLLSDRGRIDHHIVPLLGRRLVQDVTSPEVQRFIRDVQAGKTARSYKTKARGLVLVEGGPGVAARATGLLGGIFSYAIAEGLVGANPVHGVRRPADRKRDRRLSPDEFVALGRVLAEADAEGESWQSTDAIRLLCLTGCRLKEITHLRWAEVDLAGSALRLAETKEGRSIRPLGSAGRRLLQKIGRRTLSGVFVTPATRGEGGFGGVPDALERYGKRAGLLGVGAHTLRHSFASTAGDLGFSDSTIAAMLGHAGQGVTSRYIHVLDAVLVGAADRVSEQIAAAMAGGNYVRAESVVSALEGSE